MTRTPVCPECPHVSWRSQIYLRDYSYEYRQTVLGWCRGDVKGSNFGPGGGRNWQCFGGTETNCENIRLDSVLAGIRIGHLANTSTIFTARTTFIGTSHCIEIWNLIMCPCLDTTLWRCSYGTAEIKHYALIKIRWQWDFSVNLRLLYPRPLVTLNSIWVQHRYFVFKIKDQIHSTWRQSNPGLHLQTKISWLTMTEFLFYQHRKSEFPGRLTLLTSVDYGVIIIINNSKSCQYFIVTYSMEDLFSFLADKHFSHYRYLLFVIFCLYLNINC